MNKKILLMSSLVSLAITGCSGGSGSGDPLPTEVDLKNNAVAAIGSQFDGNVNAFSRTLNQNAGLGNTLTDVATGGSDDMGEDLPTDANFENEVQSWVSVSLATQESANSTTTRNGNTITVDPDEDELCRDETLFKESSAEDFVDCTAFFKDITVSLVATSEEAGELSYLYQQQLVLSLGYAPNTESIELDLGGLKTLLTGIADLDAESDQSALPTVMSGSFKLSTTATNVTEGQEAGSVSYAVAKPIRIVASNEEGEINLSMEPGTLMAINADAATGQGGMSFDLGAIAAAAPTDSGMGQMNMAGFTGQADVNPTDGELVVRNFGLSKGPFSVSVNNEEVMNAALGAFGFRVTEGTDMEPGELIIDGNMDLSLMVKQFAGNEMVDGLLAAALDVMAPNGTRFSRAGNGATQIGGAGPFTISLGETPAMGSPTLETVEVTSGQCFTDLFNDDSVAPSAEQCL